MAQKVSELLVDFGANIARIRSDMTQVRTTVTGSVARMGKAIATTRSAITGLFAGVATAALTRQFGAAIRDMQELKSVAEATGASIRGIQSIQGVAAEAGLGLKDIGTIAGQLAQSLNEATSSATSLKAQAFDALSIDPTGITDTTDLLVQVANALDQYEDGLAKSRLAMILMGESGKENIPFLKDLATAQLDVARFTDEQVAQADRLGKQWDRLGLEARYLAQEIAVGVTPALLGLGRGFLQYFEAVRLGADYLDAFKTGFFDPVDRLAELEEQIGGASERYRELAELAAKPIELRLTPADRLNDRLLGRSVNERQTQANQQARVDAQAALDELNALKAQRVQVEQRIEAAKKLKAAIDELQKPRAPLLGGGGAGGGGSAGSDPNSGIQAELDALNRRAALIDRTTESERLLYDIQTGRFKGASAGLIEEAQRAAEVVDSLEAWGAYERELTKDIEQAAKQRADARKAEADAFQRDLDGLIAQTTKAKLAESERLRSVAVEGLFSGRVDTTQFEEMLRYIDGLQRAGDSTRGMLDDLKASVEGFGRETSRQLTDMLFGGGDSWSGLFERFSREVIENFLYQAFFKEAASAASANLGNALFRLIGVAGGATQPGGGGTFNGLQPKGDTYNISVQTGVSRSEMQLGFEKAVDQAQSGILTSKRRNGVFAE